MICSTVKIRPACKIWVLYLQNEASYADFFLSWSLALSLFVCSFVNFLFFELQKWGLKTEDYLEYENDLNYEYKDDVKYEDDQDHKYKDDLKYEDNLKY